MIYSSLNNNSSKVSFKEAVISGLAPDKGLYFPEKIPKLQKSFIKKIEDLTEYEIAYESILPFVKSDIPKNELKKIIHETLSFKFPIIKISENIHSMELYHGPTLAFKDVGARFMARCLGYFNKEKKTKEITVLVATSGDTGGAVADGFLDVKGINVIILYPSKKVSNIQEKQLTTLGRNISALEVNGTFDDCQEMVKKSFLDKDILKSIRLTSANSINIGRWLPQMFYYFFAYKELKKFNKPIVISVPSGNFGNICAGLLAKKMGLPIDHFIASTNINDVIPRYLKTSKYSPKSSIQTISNAMDVGDPSNFIRISKIFNNNYNIIKSNLSGFKFEDNKTKEAIKEIYKNSNFIADPHGAVGYLGLKKYLKNHNNKIGVFMETAHPIKFIDVVENTLDIKLKLPEKIKKILKKEKRSTKINTYIELKDYLIK
tara:strand:+ start:5467 stop:6762 length:1296 start_codon:yes stop_codon:yes gene_type:complete